jgi:chromosome segregation ATPase
MHDLSFFLLKNWLPVGVSAIIFFSIGLLLAKLTWGRFTQRLSYAVEENMNLSSQWSALGASQRDLFKKLRVRWQADRDSWEATLADKELRIVTLSSQLTASGKEIPAEIVADQGLKDRIKELEAALEREKAEQRQRRDDAAKAPVISPVAQAMAAAAPADSIEAVAAAEFQARIRDLEQDLIDTHDQLHDVRAEYQKQIALVEALEAKLIENPAAKSAAELALAGEQITSLVARLADAEANTLAQAAEAAQLKALLPQRGREMRGLRRQLLSVKQKGDEFIAEQKREFLAREETFASEKEELCTGFSAKENSLFTAHLEEKTALEENITLLTGDVVRYREEIVTLEADLLSKSEALSEAEEKITGLELLQRRKASIQSDLNDACHEMYDVRRALNLRLADIAALETRLSELEIVQARNEELTQQLDTTREELAGAIQTVSQTSEQLNDITEEFTDLRHTLSERTLESESLQCQLTDARHELSDVRIAYNASVAEYQKARAEMEELEAIIEDRSAEVNDLSTELRTQRDLVRQLKNTLAETEGELEALNDESRVLNAGVHAKTAFVEEQRLRIADLELALSQRYHELNAARVEAEESSKHARYHEAQANQLEAELERRSDEFSASDRRVASAEEAVEAANAKIAALTDQLEQSGVSLAQLQEDMRQVSREKDETLRELDRVTHRVAQLEEAAAQRETQLAAISQELTESTRQAGDLDIRLNRLNTELETARGEQEVSRLGITELEEALRASDERTLQLSTRLEAKESEVSALLAELETLRVSIEARETSEVETKASLKEKESELGHLFAEFESLKASLDTSVAGEGEARSRIETLEALQADYESRLTLTAEEHEIMTVQQREENTRLTTEIEALRETIAEQTAKLESGTEQRVQSLVEVEHLQEKLEQRAESIRELQDQLSSIMLQRGSRDNEISVLKEKLLAVEAELSEARQVGGLATISSVATSAPLVDEASLAAAIHRSLTAEVAGEEEGISLDELVSKTTHHNPQKAAEPAPAPVESAGKKSTAGSDDDYSVYFNEGSATLSIAEFEKIDLCARAIRRFGRKVEVTVIGYAGSEGNPDQNERLSARRADAVRERLLEKGVSQSLVTVRGAGQDRRFTDWKARRVEMIVVPVAVAEAVN